MPVDMNSLAVQCESNRKDGMKEDKSDQEDNGEDVFMKTIIIEVYGKGSALAELDKRNPIISEAIWQALPIEGRAILWGEEVYFDLDMKLKDENPSASSEAGDICYWSPGPALCIFFGQTQPYSRVNHIGKVVQGLDLFERINAADRIVLRKKEL
jgi:hypothetical protein